MAYSGGGTSFFGFLNLVRRGAYFSAAVPAAQCWRSPVMARFGRAVMTTVWLLKSE
jgi:hypothetical protein